MKPSKKQVVIPYRIFEEHATNDIVYPCFVWHGGQSYSYVIPEVATVTDVKVDRGQKSIYKMSTSTKYNMMAVPASAVPNDAIRVHMPRVESLEQRAEITANQKLSDPIQGTDRNAVQNATHLVKKGETIEVLSKMYGVTTDDLEKLNYGKKPEEGLYYNVFPEVCFGPDPYKVGYRNNNEISGLGEIYNCSSLIEMVTNFLMGGELGVSNIRNSNMIITGKAREQVQNWDEVQILVKQAKDSLNNMQAVPGDVVKYPKKITSLITLDGSDSYITESIREKTRAALGFSNQARDFWSPVHLIGSFNLSMRVNADGQTATVAVYDSKTVSSLTDNKLGNSANSTDGRFLRSTYQRYIWTIRLK